MNGENENNGNNSNPENSQTPAEPNTNIGTNQTNPQSENTSANTEETQPVAAQTSVPSVPQSTGEMITVNFSGVVKGSQTVPKGTKVKDVLAKVAGPTVNVSLSDKSGRAMGMDRVLNDNTEITSVAKASGG